jgi:hypothetical protein
LEDSGVGGIILKWIYKKWDRKAWTGLIWLRDRWRAVVNAVMNFGFNNTRGISGLAGTLLPSQEEPCSIELSSLVMALTEQIFTKLKLARNFFTITPKFRY